MKGINEDCGTVVQKPHGLWARKWAGSLILSSFLLLPISVALPIYAQDQPEILVSTSRFYPAGWQILAINPATGAYRNVSNLLTADN